MIGLELIVPIVAMAIVTILLVYQAIQAAKHEKKSLWEVHVNGFTIGQEEQLKKFGVTIVNFEVAPRRYIVRATHAEAMDLVNFPWVKKVRSHLENDDAMLVEDDGVLCCTPGVRVPVPAPCQSNK